MPQMPLSQHSPPCSPRRHEARGRRSARAGGRGRVKLRRWEMELGAHALGEELGEDHFRRDIRPAAPFHRRFALSIVRRHFIAPKTIAMVTVYNPRSRIARKRASMLSLLTH